MKKSPVQLLESILDKVLVQPNPEYDDDQSEPSSKVLLEFHREIEPATEYWKDQPVLESGMEGRTYRVQLGVRTPPNSPAGPYSFEIVCSGIFACTADKLFKTLSPEDAIAEYGYTILFGVIREQLVSLTSRMTYGSRMLPTMSFMGDRTPPDKTATQPTGLERNDS